MFQNEVRVLSWQLPEPTCTAAEALRFGVIDGGKRPDNAA